MVRPIESMQSFNIISEKGELLLSPFSLFSDSEEGTGFVMQCYESRLNRGFSDKNIVRHVKSVIFAWRLYNWAII